jgi:1-acyl-sn-glycerol-3-phosphate acyltransferase
LKFDNKFIGPNTPRMGNALTRWIGDMILKAMGWTLHGKLPNLKKAIIIGGPHTSNWDLFLAMGSMLSVGLKFSWMMKKEAFFWPLGGLWKALGGIPIDRRTKIDVVGQVKNFFETQDKVWLGITPEGTRSKVERYKTGYLRIAKGVGVPLFIVGIDSLNKRVILDKLWEPKGEIDAENTAIKTYIESNYVGINPEKT